MRACLFIGAVAALPFAAPVPSPAQPASTLVRVTPEEQANAVLHNPDMGWVLYENYPLDPDPHGSSTLLTLPDQAFPDVGAVALMFSWQDVEVSEASYDFSRVDRAYDYWRQRGKSIQLRLSTESLVYWSTRQPPAGAGIPSYVLARLRPEEKQTRLMDGIPYVVVDARSAYYRQRLSAFLRSVREHFGPDRPVTLVDLRGFGVWGEWHSGFRYSSDTARRAGLKGVLDTWCEALSDCPLALSYSYDPDGLPELYAGPNNRFEPAFTNHFEEYLRFSAFDYALTKTNISFRRDGCGGAVHSNERRLNDQAFRLLRRAPMFGEFLGGYGAVKRGGTNWVNWMLADALSLHPNYLNLIGWQAQDALDFIRERPDLVALGLREMGYRLVPRLAQYPGCLTDGVPFELRLEWLNRGVGRALRDFQMQLSLVGAGHAYAAESPPAVLNSSQWLKGTAYPATAKVKFGRVPAGDYQLALTLHDPHSKGEIQLPLKAAAPGRYAIGRVTVLP